MGRHCLLTEEVQKRITDAIRVGNTDECAAEQAGIAARTHWYWMKRGEDARQNKENNGGRSNKFLRYLQAVERARAQAEGFHVAVVAQAAQRGDAKVSLEWLRRRRPKDWNPKEAVEAEVVHQGGTTLEIRLVPGRPPEDMVDELKAEADLAASLDKVEKPRLSHG
jgi:hypothetical protein